jgi:hypothetical protein
MQQPGEGVTYLVLSSLVARFAPITAYDTPYRALKVQISQAVYTYLALNVPLLEYG